MSDRSARGGNGDCLHVIVSANFCKSSLNKFESCTGQDVCGQFTLGVLIQFDEDRMGSKLSAP